MACGSCRSQARHLVRTAARASPSRASSRPLTTASRSPTVPSSTRIFSSPTSSSPQPPQAPSPLRQIRPFSTTEPRSLFGLGSTTQSYQVVGTTEALFKICTAPADYEVSKKSRRDGTVETIEGGEEVGEFLDPKNEWHTFFGLRPTFSNWSHVTMLHLYLLNTRVRCLERDQFRNWQQQLIDHFFFECERRMHIEHNINSAALRQRYLKDIYVQWRGLILAYDEGVFRGDATLASAVWRNLFKGEQDVDPRMLAAVVGWLRSGMKELEATSDAAFPLMSKDVVSRKVKPFWDVLERPFSQGPRLKTGPADEKAGP